MYRKSTHPQKSFTISLSAKTAHCSSDLSDTRLQPDNRNNSTSLPLTLSSLSAIVMSESIPRKLRVGWHREHFLSPLLQFHAKDAGETFELVECPGGTGEMQVKLKSGEIDLCIGA